MKKITMEQKQNNLSKNRKFSSINNTTNKPERNKNEEPSRILR